MIVRKIYLFLVYIFLLFLLLPLPVNAQSSIIIPPSKDAYVWNRTPELNEGDDSWLWICNDGGAYYDTCQALLYFILPNGYEYYPTIKLHFFVYLALNESYNLDVHRIDEPWDESLVTWNLKPDIGDYLFSQTVVDNQDYLVNIKSYLSSNRFSISLLSSLLTVNVCRIPSRESNSTKLNQFPYIELINEEQSNGIVFFSFIGFLGVIVAIFYSQKLRKKSSFNQAQGS